MARNPKQDANLAKGTKFRSADEAPRKAGKKGGVASGKARSFKALARELLTEAGNVNSFRVLMDIGEVPEDLSEEEDALSRSLEELARSMENDQ